MPTYVAFLRAINLGANRKFPKDDIRRAVEAAGFTGVETHINTGNVRFTTAMRSRARIEAALEAALLADRGFEVPTFVFRLSDFADVARDAAELAVDHPDAQHRYVDLFRAELPAVVVERIEAMSADGALFIVRGRALHTLLTPGRDYGGPAAVELSKLLGVATNRNAKVIATMAERWC